MRAVRNLAIAGAGLLLCAIPVLSHEGIVRGTITFVGNHIESRGIAGENSLGQDRMKGVIIADDATSELHLADVDCFSSSIVDKDGVPGDSAGYCAGIDKDGDVFFLWNRSTGIERRWGFFGGTGKFEKINGGGTTEYVSGEPAERLVVKWAGVYHTE
jgi:hypothetical protein